MEQFTASEVRDRKRFEEWYATHSFNYSRDPIGSRDCSLQWEAWKAARADLLEAREKAVPVAWRTFDGEGNYDYRDYENNEHYRDWYVSRNGAKYANWVEPLYTHPAPADAERLAEALRWIMRTAGDAKEPCGGDPESPAAIRNGVLASISQAAAQSLGIVQGPSLAAHSAPAASVPSQEWMMKAARSWRESDESDALSGEEQMLDRVCYAIRCAMRDAPENPND